jgi:pyridoxal/pyridoxine/pyridoxamine kinase|tara:strand:- start:43 stop:363 length:321 start_codon:yes stop_codon:yes gene_type:complete
MANTYTNAKLDLTATSVTTLYTCAASTTAIVKSIVVSEDSGNADTITLTLTNGSDVYSLFKTKSVSANGTVELLTAPLVVQATEILKVTAATANRLHVVASILEIT